MCIPSPGTEADIVDLPLVVVGGVDVDVGVDVGGVDVGVGGSVSVGGQCVAV